MNTNQRPETLFYCTRADVNAQAYYTTEGMVVLKAPLPPTTPAAKPTHISLKNAMPYWLKVSYGKKEHTACFKVIIYLKRLAAHHVSCC